MFFDHEVAGDQVCGCFVTGIRDVTSDFWKILIFNTYEEGGANLKQYIIDVVVYDHDSSNTLFAVVKLLLSSIYSQ